MTEQIQAQLIELLENQIVDLTTMSKIELGDDVIAEIGRLKKAITTSQALDYLAASAQSKGEYDSKLSKSADGASSAKTGKMTEEEWRAAEKGLPFKQFSLYEHKETIATADTPISSQTSSISDEEIMEAAYKYAEVYQCPTEIKMCKHDVISAWNKAIQWYREQLKKK